MFKLGKRSLRNMEGISPYIHIIVTRTIVISPVDFGVLNTGGFRTAEMQYHIFLDGHSKYDGYEKKSYHQSGKAVDLVPYINRKYTWYIRNAFVDIYRAWKKAENELKKEGIIPKDVYFHHGIFWTWKDLDLDGELTINDKLGWDSAHHQQNDKPQKI